MFDKSHSGDAAIAASQSTKEREYWLEKLSGEWIKSCFPYDNTGHEESGEKSGDKHRLQVSFSGELFTRLTWISNQSDIRLLTVLVGGLLVLIDKYTDTRDIIVGMPIYKQEAEGSYINTVLALRCLLQEEMTFKEFLYRVKQTIEEAIKHQNYPIKTLLYDLKLTFTQKDFPLFDIILMLKNIQDPAYVHHIPANMEFIFFRTPQCLELVVQYNPFLYEKETVARIVSHFYHLLNMVIFNVDLSLAGIDILPEREKKKLLEEFNQPREGIKDHADKTIHGLFEEQVEKTPSQAALVFIRQGKEPETLTYQQLNEKAWGLARELKAKGIGAESIVALLLESSNHMATALLAVLKAGGAYLPMDMEAPEERKAYILKDSRVRLLLTGKTGDTPLCPGAGDIEQLDVTAPGIYPRSHPGETNRTAPALQIKPADPAYIIYTSGSTGRPKGVIVEHCQAVNTLVNRKEEYGMTGGHTALQLFSYAFDGFITSFFTPVISGARVILLCKDTIQDISRVVEVITANRVTHFISVPVLFQALLTSMTEAEAASLQVVTLAGDKVQPRLVEMAAAKNRNLEVVNEYGVTEAAVMSTIYRHQERDGRVKIGHPIDNTSIYITKSSDHQRLVPIGVFGEMCIAGAGVTRGYLNKPELTAEKFYLPRPGGALFEGTRGLAPLLFTGTSRLKHSPYSPHSPITPSPHHPIYRTGDLARWLPDGNIEFSGRQDYQVKIRGYRIELGEIERQLQAHSSIKESIVTAHQGDNGEKYLCAYITGTRQLSTAELREYLVSRLPEYMIPAYFVFLEQMPLSTSGKVDRKQLPAPDTALSTKEYIPPRNRLEQKLVEIWAGVLGSNREAIGIDTDFFELGGHSLSVTLMSNRIYKDLNVKIPMVEIFKTPRIRELSEYIKGNRKESYIYMSLKMAEEKEYYPLSPAQKRLYISQQMGWENTLYNVREVLPWNGNIEKEQLENIFAKIITRHESLRTSFEVMETEVVQRVRKKVDFTIEYYEAGSIRPQTVSGSGPGKWDKIKEIIEGFVKPFDLSKAPLLRVGLIKTAVQQYLLLFDMHHIITDFKSLEILTTEFKILFAREELEPLRFQYRDFAEWQNQSEQQERMKEQEVYWLNKFQDKWSSLNLPTDFERPPMQTFKGDVVNFELSPEDILALREIAEEAEATLFMSLFTVFNILLSKLCGQEEIIVGIPIEGRTHADLEQVVGVFINTLPVRAFPTTGKSLKEFLLEVKNSVLETLDNQDYQLEELVEKLLIKRDVSRNPLIDVIFNFLDHRKYPGVNAPGRTDNDNDYGFDRTTSSFDIILFVEDFGEALFLTFIYRSQLFRKETIERFVRYFKEIIGIIRENRHIKLGDISISHELVESQNITKEEDYTAFDF